MKPYLEQFLNITSLVIILFLLLMVAQPSLVR